MEKNNRNTHPLYKTLSGTAELMTVTSKIGNNIIQLIVRKKNSYYQWKLVYQLVLNTSLNLGQLDNFLSAGATSRLVFKMVNMSNCDCQCHFIEHNYKYSEMKQSFSNLITRYLKVSVHKI